MRTPTRSTPSSCCSAACSTSATNWLQVEELWLQVEELWLQVGVRGG